jgi:hypothetical protein
VLAGRGEWVTNEKRLLERAGLRTVDGVIASLPSGATEERLAQAITQMSHAISEAAGREPGTES